jgi:BlaR1 peptidase M56
VSNAFVAFFRCVFWFNPLVHFSAGCLRLDQELACDSAVMERHPGSRRIYAGAMLKAQAADAALPVGCHWQSASQFKERLDMLKRSAPGRARRAGGRVFITLAAAVIGYSAWAAEPGAASAAASTAAPANAAPGRDSFTIDVDDTVLTFEKSVGKIRIATSRVAAPVTRGASDPLVMSGTTRFSSALDESTRVTVAPASQGSPSEVLTVKEFVVEGEGGSFRNTPEGLFLMNFNNGCVVTLIVAEAPERSISGTACRIEGHAAQP